MPWMAMPAKMPAGEVVHYPVGHFGVYLEPLFGEISDAEAGFLERNLRPRAAAPRAAAGTAA